MMTSNIKIIIITVLLLFSTFAQSEPIIELTPKTCVVKKGQLCLAKVDVVITQLKQGDEVCLMAAELNYKSCLVATRKTSFQVSVKSKSSIKFVLMDFKSNKVLTSKVLGVATFAPVATRKRRSFSWSFDVNDE